MPAFRRDRSALSLPNTRPAMCKCSAAAIVHTYNSVSNFLRESTGVNRPDLLRRMKEKRLIFLAYALAQVPFQVVITA